jgi:hypothetical protein
MLQGIFMAGGEKKKSQKRCQNILNFNEACSKKMEMKKLRTGH